MQYFSPSQFTQSISLQYTHTRYSCRL